MKKEYTITIPAFIEDHIECRQIQDLTGGFFCSMIGVHILYLSEFYDRYDDMQNECYIKYYNYTFPNLMPNHTYAQLYEFNIIEGIQIYLVCAKNRNNYNIDCFTFIYKMEYSFICPFSYGTIGLYPSSYIELSFPTSSINDQDCTLGIFGDEGLFCCGDVDFINCYRVYISSVSVKGSFKLDLPGSNSKLGVFYY